jgi:hypothetical protein
MNRTYLLACIALPVLVSCASRPVVSEVGNESYQPASKPEEKELARDRVDIYPDDIRKDPAAFAGIGVVWAGVIRSTYANEGDEAGRIEANTVFEHHYFNGIEYNNGHEAKLFISPRGEGFFRVNWHLDRIGRDATAENAENYAAPGKLALVYGVPEKVDADGTVVLRYRFLRILGADQYSTNKFDYGRFGQPVRMIQAGSPTNAPPAKPATGK